MAIISAIRNQGRIILLVILALALAAFILMDASVAAQRAQGAGQNSLGSIDGQEIDYREFSNMEQALYSNSDPDQTYNIKNYLWNFFVNKTLIDDKAEKIGFGVGEEELDELLGYGDPARLSPVIQQNFGGSQGFNPEVFNNIKAQIDNGDAPQNLTNFWDIQKTQVSTARLEEKYNDLINKSIYTPDWMVDENQKESNTTMDVSFVRLPYDLINNSDVSVSNEELKAYFNSHKAEYERKEEARVLKYASIDVVPTSQDTSEIKQLVADYMDDLKVDDGDSIFVVSNNGVFPTDYVTLENVAEPIRDDIAGANQGDVFGPYQLGSTFKITKLIDKMVLPDSVRARHILRKIQGADTPQGEQALMDSLMQVLKNGGDFASLAKEYSEDSSSSKGGDLGYAKPGSYVPGFNEIVFYTGEKGQFYMTPSRFGIHIIEILDKAYGKREMGYRLATISEDIVPSVGTQEAIERKAQEILEIDHDMTSFEEAAKNAGFAVRSSAEVRANDYNIPGVVQGSTAREILRWAFSPSAKVGAISKDIYGFQPRDQYYNNKYVITALESIKPEGFPTLEEVSPLIEPILKNEKKGDQLISQISSTDLNAVANQFGQSVQEATNINFRQANLIGVGIEPDFVAKAYLANQGDVIGPVKGNNGVIIGILNTKNEAPVTTQLGPFRKLVNDGVRNRVENNLMTSLKDRSEIDDLRSNFY